jgi:hypothetical protein
MSAALRLVRDIDGNPGQLASGKLRESVPRRGAVRHPPLLPHPQRHVGLRIESGCQAREFQLLALMQALEVCPELVESDELLCLDLR